jgi:hypothetical protein
MTSRGNCSETVMPCIDLVTSYSLLYCNQLCAVLATHYNETSNWHVSVSVWPP